MRASGGKCHNIQLTASMSRYTDYLLKNFNAISAREVNDQKDNKDSKKANDSTFFNRDHQMLQRTTHKVAIPKKMQIA